MSEGETHVVMVDLLASKDTGSYNNDVKRSKTSYARRLELQVAAAAVEVLPVVK